MSHFHTVLLSAEHPLPDPPLQGEGAGWGEGEFQTETLPGRMVVELPFGLFRTRLAQPGETPRNRGRVFKAARAEQPHLCAGPGPHQIRQRRAGINHHLGGGVDLGCG